MAKPDAPSQKEGAALAEDRPAQGEREAELLALAKTLLRTVATGALATLGPDGAPFATLVTTATDFDGAPILLTSTLSAHSRNMDADARVSLLLAARGKGDPLAHPRLTVSGRAERADSASRPRLRARFLTRHPKASLYADFADFSFWRVSLAAAHLNGGFAKAAQFSAADLITRIDDAGSLIEAERSALDHLNADHAETLDLYARAYGRRAEEGWRAVALDPEGLDLRARDEEIRIVFPRRVSTPDDLRRLLSDLARQARLQTPQV